jgi:DNA-binding NtrC family response regulator
LTKKILVVDDELGIRESFNSLLGDEYSVSLASDGEEAIEKVKREQPHLVILDLRLPGIDGLEVLRIIQDLNRNLVVVVISGINEVETAVKVMKLGASDYLPKPFHLEDIRKAIGEAFAKGRRKRGSRIGDFPILQRVIEEIGGDMLDKGASLQEAGDEFEREFANLVLERAKGDQEKAATFLGIEKDTLFSLKS